MALGNVWKRILISELTLLRTHVASIALVERLVAETVKLKSLEDKFKRRRVPEDTIRITLTPGPEVLGPCLHW